MSLVYKKLFFKKVNVRAIVFKVLNLYKDSKFLDDLIFYLFILKNITI